MSKNHKETLTCSQCNTRQQFIVWDSVNVSVDPMFKEKLINRELTTFVCNKCDYDVHVEYNCLYYDIEKSLLIWLLYPEPEDSVIIDPNFNFPFSKTYTYRSVNSFEELIDKILIFDDGLSDYAIELMKLIICIRSEKNIDCHFYYCGKEGDYLLFVIETQEGLVDHHYQMEEYQDLIKNIIPKVTSVIESIPEKWPQVNRAFMLNVLEKCELIGESEEIKKKKHVRAHIIDPLGGADLSGADDLDDIFQTMIEHQNPYRVEYWSVGRELTAEQAERWTDSETGDIYIWINYRKGETIAHAVSKSIWEQAKANLDNI